MLELHVIFKGIVQGVGFRRTVMIQAEKLQLTGTVQNLKEGSVEVHAQGSQENLEQFLENVQNDSGSAKIDSLKNQYLIPTKIFFDFRILYDKS